MRTFEKGDVSKLDYVWDWRPWLGTRIIDPEKITFTTSSDEITVDTPAHDDGQIYVIIHGGVEKKSYQVSCKIETVDGNVERKSAIFNIVPT
jgi:hypothetical protein